MTEPSLPDDAVVLPAAAAWAALGPDGWAAVLVALRTELAGRDDLDECARAVRDRPTSRMVGGRGRQGVVDLLVADPSLAARVFAQLGEQDRARLTAPAAETAAGRPSDPDRDQADEERRRLRARRLREERDDWRRRAEGAQARMARLEKDLDELRRELTERDATLAQLEGTLAEADQERDRAVQRERRRRDGEVARLEEELAERRRAEEARRADERRRVAEAQREATRREPAPRHEQVARVTPGRPTRLPAHVAPETTEAARLLLGPGRLVLIDGYNVTRTHRDDLDLEGQRAWLVQRCVTAAAALRLRPVVVFDGQRAGATRPTAARQRVEVRFTSDGITADDELVLAVEATDEPVVVVSDDRELKDRVRASGADVVGTTIFLGVVGR